MAKEAESGNTTKELAKQINDIEYNSLNNATIEKTKLAILDAIGCAVYGSQTQWSHQVAEYVKELSSRPDSTVFMGGFKSDPGNAALANGTMMHSYELDDVFMEGKMHPGAAVIPAALSVAESINANGKSLIESIVAGYEAMGRVGLGLGANAAKSRGWHITGISGTFGAAAAAGRLLNLDNEQMANAFGLAGTQSAGLFAFIADGAMTKRLHPGRSSQSGVMSAILAKKGFRGPTKVLEAPDGGFLKTFSDGYDLGKVLRKENERLIIDRAGFKLYSCCGSVHPALDATKKIMDQYGIREDQVEGIEVGVSRVVQDQCGWDYEPLSTLQAQMSLKYCVASMVRDGDVFLDQFTDNKIQDQKTIDLTKKVSVYVDKQSDSIYPRKNPAMVTLIVNGGKKHSLYVDEPKGLSEGGAATREDIVGKFMTLTRSFLDVANSNGIVESVLGIDRSDNIKSIFQMLGQ